MRRIDLSAHVAQLLVDEPSRRLLVEVDLLSSGRSAGDELLDLLRGFSRARAPTGIPRAGAVRRLASVGSLR